MDEQVDRPGSDCVSDTSLWIFGYGSLVWRAGFPHLRARPASIGGFARRFWQGSTDHRGMPSRPGRVVTLLPDHHESLSDDPYARRERCWGMAYEIPAKDPEGVLASLDHRERGGYERVRLEIEVQGAAYSGSRIAEESTLLVVGLVYIAGPENGNYLGAASIEEIAGQIAGASGPSGSNPEYVMELANRLRAMDAIDSHVFAVESELLRLLS